MFSQISFALLLGLSLTAAHAFEGSSYNEVLGVLGDKNFVPQTEEEKAEFAVYQAGQLPQYDMSMQSIFARGKAILERDAKRTISDKSDYFPRLEKLLHPNGVCVAGKWKMTEENPYTGYFRQGSEALFIGRVSVAMKKTTSKNDRGFGFAGKLFPTKDPQQKVLTTNFFTVDILMGENTPRFLETAVTNEPESGFKLGLLKLGLKITSALKKADQSPMFRPVAPIAKIGEADGAAKSPKWIRVSAEDGTLVNDEADFRREVLKGQADNGVLKLKVEVSDTTKNRFAKTGWNKVGVIEVERAMVSYGCDRRLHFNHPKHND